MEMPKPGEAHARLQKLVGRWRGRRDAVSGALGSGWGHGHGRRREPRRARRLRGRAGVPADPSTAVTELRRPRRVLVGPGAASQHVMTWFDAMSGTADRVSRWLRRATSCASSHAMPQGGYLAVLVRLRHARPLRRSGWKCRRTAATGRRRWKARMPACRRRRRATSVGGAVGPRMPRGRRPRRSRVAGGGASGRAAKSASPRVPGDERRRGRAAAATRNGGKRGGRGGRRR